MYEGFVLFCDKTQQERCLTNKQYSCTGKETTPSNKIKEGSIIFLYNTNDKSLLGPFTALNEGAKKVDRGAWRMDVDEHSASENVKLEWEQLHRLENAAVQLDFLESPRTCELTTTQTQRVLDLLKQSPLYTKKTNKKKSRVSKK